MQSQPRRKQAPITTHDYYQKHPQEIIKYQSIDFVSFFLIKNNASTVHWNNRTKEGTL